MKILAYHMAELRGIRVFHKILRKSDPKYYLKDVLKDLTVLIDQLKKKDGEIHIVVHITPKED